MKKLIFILFIPIFLMILVSCNTTNETINQDAYIQAQTAGFTGTYTKWKSLIKGIDEDSISDVVSENGELIIITKTGDKINLGKVNETFVPVYQGMSVKSIDYSSSKKRILNMKVKDAIDDYLDIITTEKVEYYAKKNELFDIVIHLYNPSSFEILSFTLNNQKYQAYQFKEGSTSTELIIEVEADSNPGIKEYTIDAIKYIDNTEIKDVKMEGSKTIKVGVKYDIVPTSTLISEQLTTSSYEQIVEIKDESKLIKNSQSLYFFLYDGTSIVYEQLLNLGINNILYEDIKLGLTYEYMIVGIYDDFSGDGNKATPLMSGTIEAFNGVNVTNINTTNKTINFELVKITPTVTLLETNLYDQSAKIKTSLNDTNITFDNLESNHDYMIEVVYSYDYQGVSRIATFKLDVQTKKSKVPTFEITNLLAGKKEISYLVTPQDLDGVITSQKYTLLKDEYIVQTKTNKQDSFINLSSNTTYVFEVLYQYDLNDGEGEHELKQQVTLKTQVLNVPSIDITTITTDNQILLKELISDVDDTIKSPTQITIDDSTITITKNSDQEYLLINAKSNYTYVITVYYQYDLNDGLGIIDEVKEFKVTTKKQVPVLKFNPYNISQKNIEFDLIVLDNNVTGRINLITLYKGLTFIKKLPNNASKIEDLEPDTNYTIKFNYVYDFDDGFGSREINEEYTFKTLKHVPSYQLTINYVDYTTFEYTHELGDLDGVLKFKKLEVLLNNTVVDEKTSIDDNKVQNLLADRTYKVNVVFERDLNSGVEEIIYTYYVTTDKYQKPEVEINLESTKNTILYNYKINDEFGISSFYKATIYYNNKELDIKDNNQIFSNLLSNSLYTVRITLANDYHDGRAVKYEQYATSIKTKQLEDIDFIITLESTKKTISYFYKIADLDLIASIVEVRLYYGYELVQTITDLNENTFDNLYSDNNYRVVIIVKKDFRDGSSPKYSEYSESIWTKSLETPTITLNCTPTRESIYYEVIKEDVDNTFRNGYIKYRKSDEGGEFTILQGNTNQIISNLTPHTKYLVTFCYEYNLNDNKNNAMTRVEKVCTTLSAEINITKIEVLNVETPKTNEDISLKVYIENKYQVEILSVIINGQECICSNSELGDVNTWFITQVAAPKVGGIMTITIEKFKYFVPNDYYEQKIIGNNTIDVEVMSRLDIIDITLADGTTTDLEGQSNGYIIKVDNPYGYTITEIGYKEGISNTYGSVYPIRVDDTHWYVDEIYKENYRFYVSSIRYIDNNGHETVRKYNDVISLNFAINNTGIDETIKVYTPEGFMNMKDDKNYELACDIDMAGYNWEPYTFRGYFDGKGHTISNLTDIHEDKWKNDYSNYARATSFMLFDVGSIFKNVYFKDIYFSTDSTAWYSSNIQLFNSSDANNSLEQVFKNVLISGIINTKMAGKVETYPFILPSSTTYVVNSMTVNGEKCQYTSSVTSDELENGDFKQKVLKWNFSSQSFEEGSDFMYKVIDDSYVVLLNYSGDNSTASVPLTIKRLPVIGIMSSTFANNLQIKRIEIPSSILFIGSNALSGCYNIESIKMENLDVKSINDLFGDKEYNNSYAINENLTGYTRYIPESLRKLELGSKSHTIKSNAFSEYQSLETVILEDDIENICDNAFNSCSNLIDINMPKSLKTIERYSFSDTMILQIKIPDMVTVINDYTFANCHNLSKIELSPYTTTILEGAFTWCKSLASITLPDTIEHLDTCAFGYCTSLTSITLPSTLTTIPDSAFVSCEKLTTINIPDTVKSIGASAFANCRKLISVILPKNIKVIESRTFEECSNLKEITIPDTVHTIKSRAFNFCANLGKINIGDNVTSIEEYAFDGCPKLTLFIPLSVKKIGSNAFCTSNIIYCEAKRKPELWSDDWCIGSVQWGTTRT